MRLVRLPKAVIFLCMLLLVLIIFNNLWPSVSRRSFQFVSEPLFVFPVFNIIVLAIVARSRWSSAEELERLLLTNFLSCPPPYELRTNDQHDETRSENSDTSKDSEHSDGGDGDDEYDSGWQGMDEDEYEYDGNLEKRIEDFINKVNRGWREERLRDNLSNQFQFVLL